MRGRIALFDMDGTLFDHDTPLMQDLKAIQSPSEELPDTIQKCRDIPWLEARIQLIRSKPGWWKNLPKFQLGWHILEMCQMIGFCCSILTKGPRRTSLAWMEKVECINTHLGEDFPIDIMGKNKNHRYGRILVDDFPEYLLGWLEHRKRGLAIMPAHPYNKDFTHPNVIRYQGTAEDMSKVWKAIQAAYDREEKQHWKELLK